MCWLFSSVLDYYSFPESEKNAISRVSNLLKCPPSVITIRDALGIEKEKWNWQLLTKGSIFGVIEQSIL